MNLDTSVVYTVPAAFARRGALLESLATKNIEYIGLAMLGQAIDSDKALKWVRTTDGLIDAYDDVRIVEGAAASMSIAEICEHQTQQSVAEAEIILSLSNMADYTDWLAKEEADHSRRPLSDVDFNSLAQIYRGRLDMRRKLATPQAA